MITELVMLKRSPEISVEEFRAFYESEHAPLAIPYLSGTTSYLRRYLTPLTSTYDESAEAGDFDVIAEVVFETRKDMQSSLRRLNTPEATGIDVGRDKLFDLPATRAFVVDEVKHSDL